MVLNRKIYTILIFGLLISFAYSFLTVIKFDKYNKSNNHLMVRGDIQLIWEEASDFKKDFFERDKNIFEAGKEYTRTYLPSKILAFYSQIFNLKILNENNLVGINNYGKIFYLFFQSLIYYFSIFYFFIKFKYYTQDNIVAYYSLFFLSIEPTILQWHSSFWTESFYLSIQNFLLGFVLDKKKTLPKYFIIGLIFGLMFLQKTVAVFLIFFFIFFVFINEKSKKLLKISFLLFGYSLIIFFIIQNNYVKTDKRYIMPLQTKDAHYASLIPMIYEKNKNYEEFKKLINDEEEWKKSTNYNYQNYSDIIKFYEYKQSKAIDIMLKNKIIVIEIYLKKIFHHALLNPVQVYYWHEYNNSKYENIEYHLSEDKKKWLFWRIIYSVAVYLIMLLGLIKIFTDQKDKNYYFFILLIIFYYVFMLGWLGNTRYFITSYILLSVFFGHGASLAIRYLKKYYYLSINKK